VTTASRAGPIGFAAILVTAADADRIAREIQPMLFFGRKKRLIDYASCAG
jgi:hypothetical protein